MKALDYHALKGSACSEKPGIEAQPVRWVNYCKLHYAGFFII